MDRVLIFIIGGIFGAIGVLLFYNRKNDSPNECEEDPTGEKKQQIFDTLTKLKSDIESTVN